MEYGAIDLQKESQIRIVMDGGDIVDRRIATSRIWTEWRASLVIVQPDTVLAWHRHGFRLYWTIKSRRRTGRPAE
jgi:hypothetical protein